MDDGSVDPVNEALRAPEAPPVAALQPRPGELAVVSDRVADAVAGPVAGLLFCGGFHSSMQGTKALRCRAFAQRHRLDCHRFDYRGHGASPGNAAALGIEHWLNDTLSVLDGVSGAQLLIGSSMGAWLALLAARARPDRVAGVLTLAAAPDFTERLMRPALSAAQRDALGAGRLAFRHSEWDENPWPLPPVLLDSGRRLSILSPVNALAPAPLGCPLSVLHGTADTDVPPALSLELFAALGSRHDELVLLHGADHRLSDPQALGVFERTLQALLARANVTGPPPGRPRR